MKKTSFSFRALHFGRYLHRFFLSKTRRRLLRDAAVTIGAAIYISNASAQCNTFRNADAASPIAGLVPSGKYLSGFNFVDIDADGDQDLYMYYHGETAPRFFRNTGNATHPVFTEEAATGFTSTVKAYSDADMQFVDIDGDGDYDFFISDYNFFLYTDAHIHFYKNTGTRKTPRFEETPAENPVSFARSSIEVAFSFADIDNDGDYDFTYVNADENGNPPSEFVYNNIGTATQLKYKLYSYNQSYANGGARLYYDWNKDGRADYFQYNYGRATEDYFRNTATGKRPAYVKDMNSGPVFKHGYPYRLIDLNADGAPEVFDENFRYSILVPVAVVKDSVLQNGNTALYSKNQSGEYAYRWEVNGKTITGANKYYITPKQPGTYTLYVTDSCGTGVSLNYAFSKTGFAPEYTDSRAAGVASITGISAKAYPNPFTSAITLQLTGKPCTVKIVDLAGRVLLSQTTSAATLQTGQSLKSGTYLVQVWEGKELVYKTTVVKQ